MGCSCSKETLITEFLGRHKTRQSDILNEADDPDVALGGKSRSDLLAAQRQKSPDITKNLEERWMNYHFIHATSRLSNNRVKRRRLSHVTAADERSTGSSSDVGSACIEASESVLPLNSLLPAADATECNEAEIKHTFTILHFNDVYDIFERTQEPIGGAARFSGLLKKKLAEELQRSGEQPLVLFSGDCLNPSLLSCATKGRHMIEVFDHLEVDAAVFGNHEFDFGVDHATSCTNQMKCAWLLGNVEDRFTQKNLAGGGDSFIVTRNSGLKIGIIGLVEEEWLDTLSSIEKSDLIYTDYVDSARRLSKELKEQGVQFIIALTHMRWPNDIRLAHEVADIDIILGGHDHEYGVKDIDACLIIKSGCDFRNFTAIDVFVAKTKAIDVRLTRYDITHNTSVDPAMKNIVTDYMDLLQHSLDQCIGTIGTELNGKYSLMRTEESELGNFFADIVAAATRADVVLINSGSFRSDTVHPKGDFRLNDLMTILPIIDTVVTVLITGSQLLEVLENAVSKYPKHEGRFPQISGAYFGFDPDAPPGRRVIFETVRVCGQPIQLNTAYHLATKAYVARGKDGFQSLAKCPLLNDPDASPLLSTVVRNHLANVQRILDFETKNNCKIQIAKDGKSLTCNNSELDVSQAFLIDEQVATIQQSQTNAANTESNTTPKIKLNMLSYGHVPPFLSLDLSFESEKPKDEIEEKIMELKKAKREKNPTNAALLKERFENPHDVKWQFTPLLEGRIFHCHKFTKS